MDWLEEKEKLGKEIISFLFRNGLIKTWYRHKPEGWKMVSGLWSPFYIQLRLIPSLKNAREILKKIGYGLGKLIKAEADEVTKVAGVAMAGIPIALSITMETSIPSCYTRKLPGVKKLEDLEKILKEYGEHKLVEGEIENGDKLAIVDDLVTRFDSKLVALRQIMLELKKRKLRAECKHVVVLVDREQGAYETAKRYGIELHSLIPFKTKGIEWLRDELEEIEYQTIKDYLLNPEKYQNPETQRELKQKAEV
ncbi:MAG: hypothetical protein J7K98_04315 [Candidatus Aenigmarchaeota archaeon]|nr:hypothetical protein [Candidatus Aenigmarchaeota archaeon]